MSILYRTYLWQLESAAISRFFLAIIIGPFVCNACNLPMLPTTTCASYLTCQDTREGTYSDYDRVQSSSVLQDSAV
jgi:hypothetical protein